MKLKNVTRLGLGLLCLTAIGLFQNCGQTSFGQDTSPATSATPASSTGSVDNGSGSVDSSSLAGSPSTASPTPAPPSNVANSGTSTTTVSPAPTANASICGPLQQYYSTWEYFFNAQGALTASPAECQAFCNTVSGAQCCMYMTHLYQQQNCFAFTGGSCQAKFQYASPGFVGYYASLCVSADSSH